MSSPVATLSLVLLPGNRKKETHKMSFFSAKVIFLYFVPDGKESIGAVDETPQPVGERSDISLHSVAMCSETEKGG